MGGGGIYYCWSCDGHCRAEAHPDQPPRCPRCGQQLTEDSRVAHGPHPVASPSFLQLGAMLPLSISVRERLAA